MPTQVIWKYFTNKCHNMAYFLDANFNFSNKQCVLPSTLCMTGELWMSSFLWHQDIRVTNCQSSAMTFIFTQYYFCNSFRHRLIYFCPLPFSDYIVLKYYFQLAHIMTTFVFRCLNWTLWYRDCLILWCLF